MIRGLEIRTLKPYDITAMHIAFLEAFSDYKLVVSMDQDQFIRKIIDKLQLKFELSAAAFIEHKMVGFIFTGQGYYRNQLTAYNGGTGVVPGFRGHGITRLIYEYLFPVFSKATIQVCLLEVLTVNTLAERVYHKVGFRRTRLFRCFIFKKSRIMPPEYPVLIASRADFATYESFWDLAPSYLDHSALLQKNLHNEKIIEIHKTEQLAGYAIYQPQLGRISQLAVNPKFRRQKVGTRLIEYIVEDCKDKPVTILNVDNSANSIIRFAKKTGFENQVNQHEMIYDLKPQIA